MISFKKIYNFSVPVLFFCLLCLESSLALVTSTFSEDELNAARETVRMLYLEYLEREADEAGLDIHVDMLLAGDRSESQIASALQASPEGQRVQARRQEAQQQARRDRWVKRWEQWGNLFHAYAHVLYSLGIAIVLGLIISQVYKHTHRGMNYELSFMSTLVLLAPIVAMVMLFIRGDLVLSLGLIGSLSIIRFRTPIKDTRDMIFLFWTIAVGLGAGTYNWMVIILASLILTPIVFLLYFIKYGRASQADFILVCGGEGAYPGDEIEPIISSKVRDASIRSHELNGDVWETVYELRSTEAGAGMVNALAQKLNQLPSVRKVSLLAPKLDLPV